MSAQTSRSSWTNKTTSQTKIPITKRKDTDKKFLRIKEDRSAGVRTKGEVREKRQEKKKTEERERLTFQPIPVDIYSGTSLCAFRKDQWRTSILSTTHQGDQPRNQTVVCCLWERAQRRTLTCAYTSI